MYYPLETFFHVRQFQEDNIKTFDCFCITSKELIMNLVVDTGTTRGLSVTINYYKKGLR